MNKSELEQKIDSLGFTDDLIFKLVLSSHPDICKELIRRIIPGTDVSDLRYLSTEHEIIVDLKEKRIRLDMYAENDRDRYDLEMYQWRPDSIEKTAEYHASMMASDLRIAGTPDELKNITVILFCAFDPFKLERPVYHVHEILDDDPAHIYNGIVHKYFISNRGIDQASDEMKPVIQLLKQNPEQMDDPFYQKIQNAVNEAKRDSAKRKIIMLQLEWEQAIRKQARKEERKNSIQKMMAELRDIGLKEDDILSRLLKNYPDDEENIWELMKQN